MESDDESVELLLRYTRSAHEAGGYPANELEPRIVELATALGLDSVQVSATPTSVELAVGSIPNQHVYVLRVQPHPIDLYAIGRLDAIAAGIAEGSLDRHRALEEIEELGRHPLRRPVWLVVASYAAAGAGLASVLGGGWRESLAAAMVGLAVGSLTHVVMREKRYAPLVTPLGALLASLLACALAHAGFDIAVADVTLAALVVLLPGLTMATGMRELATGHPQAGLANSANALVQLVGLGFGVAVGRSLATSWLGPTPINTPHPFPRGVEIAAAVVAGLAFVVTLRAPARDAFFTCSAALFAVVSNTLATRLLGAIAGVFAAALVVGLAGNVTARRFRHSPLTFIVPGFLMLVPGSIGYQSAASLMAGSTVTGIDTAFDALLTLLAIAYGLVAARLLLPHQTTRRIG